MLIFSRHSEDMINRLERAGLGYHVNFNETGDKLGNFITIFEHKKIFLKFHVKNIFQNQNLKSNCYISRVALTNTYFIL